MPVDLPGTPPGNGSGRERFTRAVADGVQRERQRVGGFERRDDPFTCRQRLERIGAGTQDALDSGIERAAPVAAMNDPL